jgi:tetratricopeptide (TPR) repeat protein
MTENDKEKRAFLLDKTTDAQSLIYQGKKDEAIKCYDGILVKYPGEISALYGKGMVYYQFDDLEEALKQFDTVLRIDSEEVDTLYAKGAILRNMGKNKEALPILNKTVELAPKMHIAWLAKGYLHLDEKSFEKALGCFERVEKLGFNEMTFVGKGHALRGMGKIENAIIIYKKALDKDPYDAEALFGLGVIELKNDNPKKALEYLYKSVVQDEEIIESWEALVEVYRLLKKPDKEEIARNKVKELKEN